MQIETITGRHNPLLTHLRKLSSSRAYRQECGEYLCDGTKLLGEALQWRAPIVTAVFAEGAELPPLPEHTRTVRVSGELMRSVSPAETPQGVLFTVRLPDTALPERVERGRFLLLDGVQDPGNVGTILRTADAFACGGVFLVNACADPFGPKAVRATMGAIFRTRIFFASPEQVSSLLQKCGVPLYGAALRDDTAPLEQTDLSCAAVAIGSEGKGLCEDVLRRCAKTFRIPMEPRCESLNAAMAAGIALWEGYRRGRADRTDFAEEE